jgi:hypothetical protein
MKISRRKFLEMGAVTSISSPFLISACTGNQKYSDQVNTLFDQFQNPPMSARPFVRWWWNGDKLSEKEILRELDLLLEAGIGGVEINPIRFPDGCDPVGYESLEWLSPEWLQMLKVTLDGAHERGIICDIIVGSGWPFGGEFLEKDEQTQLMTFETIDLEGPGKFTFQLNELLEKVDPGIHSKNEKVFREIEGIRLAEYDMKEFNPGLELIDQVQDDMIRLDVPEGRHVLYYLVKLTGFQAVINGAPGAAGPVLNHYNKTAVEKYLNRMSDGLSGIMNDMGDHFRGMFCDSLEMEGANWYNDLPEEFERRRGYALTPYLPFVLYKIGHMGNPVDEEYGCTFSDQLELDLQRVRYDFYITRMELFKERFIDTFNTWCHQHRVKSRIQAYGRGYHPLEASMDIDIPECETWLRDTVGSDFSDRGWRGRAYSEINKFVASGARLSGNNLVSCEEITNTTMVFNATLETIKVAGDQSNLSGVTHSILHGFNYSPPEAPFPGWVQYGTFFNERNPWWPYLRLWTDYKARLSEVFMNADAVADIAILHPLADMWMKFGPQRDPFPVVKYPPYQHNIWEPIQQSGFGCDYVSEKVLQESTSSDGYIRYKSRNYSTLILLEVETMLPETAKALEQFAESGGKIIFIEKTPFQSPGFMDSTNNDAKVNGIIEKLLTNHKDKVGIHPAPEENMISWFKNLQDRFGLKPYMEITNPDKFINQNYFQYKDLDIFFFSNSNANESREVAVRFKSNGKRPWLWDAETGKRHLLQDNSVDSELNLLFGPAGSKLIVFESPEEKKSSSEVLLPFQSPERDDSVVPITVEGPWKLDLEHVDGSNRSLELPELLDFLEDSKLKTFAGIAHYSKILEITDPGDYSTIDLGKVVGVSELLLNGKSMGIRWHGNHTYLLEGNLHAGQNELEIKVTTVLGNYLKSLEDNPVAKRWISWQEYRSQGLIGPVSLT